MSRAERARQFMPFAALRGFEELVKAQTVTPEPRHILSEEEEQALSRKVSALQTGELVTVQFYENGGYETVCGILTDLDLANRRLTVVRRHISLDDIRDVMQEKNG